MTADFSIGGGYLRLPPFLYSVVLCPTDNIYINISITDFIYFYHLKSAKKTGLSEILSASPVCFFPYPVMRMSLLFQSCLQALLLPCRGLLLSPFCRDMLLRISLPLPPLAACCPARTVLLLYTARLL